MMQTWRVYSQANLPVWKSHCGGAPAVGLAGLLSSDRLVPAVAAYAADVVVLSLGSCCILLGVCCCRQQSQVVQRMRKIPSSPLGQG